MTPLTALLLMLLPTCVLPAQVVQVSGGVSTLDQARGGEVTVRGTNYEGSLGGGFVDGHLFAGGRVTRELERGRLTLGSTQINMDLPTDVFDRGHYLSGLGLGFSTEGRTSRTYLFAGATDSGFNTPWFEAGALEQPALLVRTSAVDGDTEASMTVLLADALTVLGSLEVKSDDQQTRFAATAGLGAGAPYGAASLSAHRARFDLDAAYIGASDRFRRARLRTQLTAEPVADNVQLTMRLAPKLAITASRQHFLTPVADSNDNTRSSVNQATANVQVLGLDLAATVSDSSDGRRSNLASFVSANRTFGRATSVQAAYLMSRPSAGQGSGAFISSVHRVLTPRWTVSGVSNVSNGQVTAGMGGSFLSNVATVSVDYQTFYVPARLDSPFERALITSVQLHLFGRVTLSETSFVAPDGHLLYTAGGDGLISRSGVGRQAPAERNAIGRMLLRGRVMTVAGEPVAGAAVMVDQLLVYTDSRGVFEVRERKARAHAVAVRGDHFLEGGVYQTVAAPAIAWSSPSASAGQGEVLIVRRLPLKNLPLKALPPAGLPRETLANKGAS